MRVADNYKVTVAVMVDREGVRRCSHFPNQATEDSALESLRGFECLLSNPEKTKFIANVAVV